jgi:hypothetical protein
MEKEVREHEFGPRMAELQKEATAEPFVGAQALLVRGEIAVDEEHRSRRVLPNLADESEVSREARIHLGAKDGRVSEFRRTQPRA